MSPCLGEGQVVLSRPLNIPEFAVCHWPGRRTRRDSATPFVEKRVRSSADVGKDMDAFSVVIVWLLSVASGPCLLAELRRVAALQGSAAGSRPSGVCPHEETCHVGQRQWTLREPAGRRSRPPADVRSARLTFGRGISAALPVLPALQSLRRPGCGSCQMSVGFKVEVQKSVGHLGNPCVCSQTDGCLARPGRPRREDIRSSLNKSCTSKGRAGTW